MSEHAKIGEVGFALQSGEGVPASNPTYALGSMNGFPGPRQDLTIREPAGHRLVTQEIRKAGIHWEVASTMWAHAASVGSLIKGILPTENVTGSGPYAHAFTPGATDRFITFFSTRPGPLYERFDDGLIESLIFDFAPSSRVAVTVQASGKTPRILGGAYTAGTRESDAADGDIFHFVGATIEFDWASSPATTVRTIDNGSLRLTRPLTVVPTADAQGPLKLLRGSLAVETTMQLLLEDYDGYRATFMGGTGGNTPSPTVVQGSLELLFVSATTPTHTLKIEIPSIWWEWTPPEPAARPGALVVDLTGYAWRPSSGAFVTITLTNGGDVPTGFQPSDISGLVFEMHPDKEGAWNDGDALPNLTDWSGSGHTLEQPTAGNRPTLQTNEIHGRAVARFGAGDYMKTVDNVVTSQPFTFVHVGKTTPISNFMIAVSDDPGTPYHGLSPSNTYHLGGDNGVGPDSPVTDGNPHIVIAIVDGASSTIYLDGELPVDTETAGTGGIDGKLRVGDFDDAGGYPWNGDIGLELLYNKRLSVAEANRIGHWAEDYFGIAWTDVT